MDLFSGAGGMSLGFEQAGFDIVLAVDRDPYHVAVHKRNFPYGAVICGSVADLTGERILAAAGLEGEPDLVFGGPPCQGFSHMGLRDPGDQRNTLVDEFVRIVGELRPNAVVIENVVGMHSGKTRPIFERALSSLKTHGYRVTAPVRTLNAADFGVPQSRERLFILALRDDFGGEISYPKGPCHGQPDRPTVLQAIGDLPNLELHERLFSKDVIPYDNVPGEKDDYALVARGIQADPSDFSHTWLASRGLLGLSASQAQCSRRGVVFRHKAGEDGPWTQAAET